MNLPDVDNFGLPLLEKLELPAHQKIKEVITELGRIEIELKSAGEDYLSSEVRRNREILLKVIQRL